MSKQRYQRRNYRTPIKVYLLDAGDDFEAPSGEWKMQFEDRARIQNIRPDERVELDELVGTATGMISCRFSSDWAKLMADATRIRIDAGEQCYAVLSAVDQDHMHDEVLLSVTRTSGVPAS